MGKTIQGFSEDAYAAFYAYPWPGNIRELENVVERAVVLCTKQRISTACLPEELVHQGAEQDLNLSQRPPTQAAETPTGADQALFRRSTAQAEADLIRKALAHNGNNRTLAARELGIHRATLYRKIKQYGIEQD
jgi:two-component system response regulator HydG